MKIVRNFQFTLKYSPPLPALISFQTIEVLQSVSLPYFVSTIT